MLIFLEQAAMHSLKYSLKCCNSLKTLKKCVLGVGHWDEWVGKGTCHQVWHSIPRSHMVEREQISASCPLTSTCVLWWQHAYSLKNKYTDK